jgi:hypothetical protein
LAIPKNREPLNATLLAELSGRRFMRKTRFADARKYLRSAALSAAFFGSGLKNAT